MSVGSHQRVRRRGIVFEGTSGEDIHVAQVSGGGLGTCAYISFRHTLIGCARA
eukprot:COSAG01_NODE_285_length_19434_cov_131.491777_9_plen_53_part_00